MVCTKDRREECKVQFGKHFEWTCKHCPQNINRIVEDAGK